MTVKMDSVTLRFPSAAASVSLLALHLVIVESSAR